MSARSVEARLFLTCWLLVAVHFATNLAREHYPAFALVDHGTLQVDEYEGLHSDIFVHADGHAYIDNQVGASFVAALPLLVFDPLLDRLEEVRKREIAAGGAQEVEFASEYPGRARFFAEVRRRGLDLRFGAAAAVTTAFAMAPLAAFCAVLVLRLLRRGGVPQERALWLALVFALGTPVLYRAVSLSNNLLVMAGTLGALYLAWDAPLTRARAFAAGLLAGSGLAFDYSGVVLPPCLWAWIVLRRRSSAGWRAALLESIPFALGVLPSLLFLWWTQWIQFGSPFLPAQHWMPAANFTDQGWRGLSLPELDLLVENLTSPNWGLVPFAPILCLALVPRRFFSGQLVLPASQRRFALLYTLAFLVFCSMNQYARMQWNTGFRYLLPLVPVLYLAACDALARLPRALVAVIGGLAILHTWVLTSVRYLVQPHELDGSAVRECWRRLLERGPTLPWLDTLRLASPDPSSLVHAAWVPWAVFAAAGACTALVWTAGRTRST